MLAVVFCEKSVLGREQKFFVKKKEELLRTAKGKFVLIKHEKILGIYDSTEEAYKQGLDKIGNQPMYIQKIL